MSNSKDENTPLIPQTIMIPTLSSQFNLYLSSLSSSVENIAHSDADSDDSEPFSLLDVDENFLDYLFRKENAELAQEYQSDIDISSTEVNPSENEKDDDDENHSKCCSGFSLLRFW